MANAERAVELLGRSCETGNGLACATLGTVYVAGNGVETNAELGAIMVQTGCESGDLGACYHLAGYYRDGTGVDANGQRARQLATFSCDAGYAPSCNLWLKLTVAHNRSTELADESVPKTSKAVVDGLTVRCELGEANACNRLGMFTKDASLARGLFDKACQTGDQLACGTLGRMLQTGQGGEPDLDRSLGLLREACRSRDERSCRWLQLAVEGGYEPPSETPEFTATPPE